MRAWFASSARLEAADRLAVAFFAIFAAAGGLAKASGAPTWTAVALGAVGVAGAVVALVLKALQERARSGEASAALLARAPQRIAEAAANGAFYAIGVDIEAYDALDALGWSGHEHAPYLLRDVDERGDKGRPALRPALVQAAGSPGMSLIVVSGRSKAGKSRTLLEAAAAALPDGWLLVPKDPPALARLAAHGAPRETRAGPLLVWLDDIEPWVRPHDEGLNAQTLEALAGWDRPPLLLATAGGKGVEIAGSEATQFRELTGDLLARARRFQLDPELSGAEAERLGEERVARTADGGLGEFMVAAPRLVDRLEHDRDCPEGQAIVRAAIDCRRAGLLRPLPAAWLEALYDEYLPAPPPEGAFARGLAWATRPLYATTALLRRADAETEAYEPYDFLVDHAARQGRTILPRTWDKAIDVYAESGDDRLNVAASAHAAGDLVRAERAIRAADDLGDPLGAFNLGVLLEQRGELAEAEAAFRRAEERGEHEGATGLGVLLEQRGEFAEAEAAYRRADEHGSGAGAVNLALLVSERGERAEAEAAFRRADERGDGDGALHLGVLLEQRGELAEAEAAFRRADERDHGTAASYLGVLLEERGELAEAEAAYRRADERGHGGGAFNLGLVLQERGALDEAEAAYRRADERGDAKGAVNLGRLLEERGELAEAEAAFRRADKRGNAKGAVNIARLLEERGEFADAEAAYRRAAERGDAAAAFDLGTLLHKHGDPDEAEAIFRRADADGYGDGAYNLGILLEGRGELVEAEAAFRRADERGNAAAAFNLGVLLARRGELTEAEAAYRRADERGDEAGALNLGVLLEQRGKRKEAEAAYRRADERGAAEGASNLGSLLQDRGKLEEAEAAYRRAAERGNAGGAFNLGVLLEQRGELEEAKSVYGLALELAGTTQDSEVAERVAEALSDLGA